MAKYTLIISQYYHSRHMFIVKHDENFIENARNFTKELMLYKRDENNNRELFLGDLDAEYLTNGIKNRYNVNDSGDIYFIQSDYANYCMSVAMGYQKDSIRESRGYQKKAVTNAIGEHHWYKEVKEIVEKYFEIV